MSLQNQVHSHPTNYKDEPNDYFVIGETPLIEAARKGFKDVRWIGLPDSYC